MIHRAIIILLSVGAVACGVAWIASYHHVFFQRTSYVSSDPALPPWERDQIVQVALSDGFLFAECTMDEPDVPAEVEEYYRSGVLAELEEDYRQTYPAGTTWATGPRAKADATMHSLYLANVRAYRWRPALVRFSGKVEFCSPLWFPMLVLAAYPSLAFIRGPLRRRRRRKRGFCITCGYDLTGNVSGQCPECGRETK